MRIVYSGGSLQGKGFTWEKPSMEEFQVGREYFS